MKIKSTLQLKIASTVLTEHETKGCYSIIMYIKSRNQRSFFFFFLNYCKYFKKTIDNCHKLSNYKFSCVVVIKCYNSD